MPPKNTTKNQAAAAAAAASAGSDDDQSLIIQEPYIDKADHQLVEEKVIEPIPMTAKGIRVRNWFITYWVCGEPKILMPRGESIMYYCTQLEVCPDTDRLHGHMYIELKDPVSRAGICKLLDKKLGEVWPAVRRGTQKQAIDYCCKDYTRLQGCTPFHYGTPKRAGHRSDLDAIAESVFDGFTKAQIVGAYGGNGFRHLGMVDKLQKSLAGEDLIDNFMTIKRKLWEEHNKKRARNKDPNDREPIPFWRYSLIYNSAEVKAVYNEEYHQSALQLTAEMKDKKDLEDEEEREGRYNESMLLALQEAEAVEATVDELQAKLEELHPLVVGGFPAKIPMKKIFPDLVPSDFVGILDAKTLRPVGASYGLPHYVQGIDDKKNFYYVGITPPVPERSQSQEEEEEDSSEDDDIPPIVD